MNVSCTFCMCVLSQAPTILIVLNVGVFSKLISASRDGVWLLHFHFSGEQFVRIELYFNIKYCELICFRLAEILNCFHYVPINYDKKKWFRGTKFIQMCSIGGFRCVWIFCAYAILMICIQYVRSLIGMKILFLNYATSFRLSGLSLSRSYKSA